MTQVTPPISSASPSTSTDALDVASLLHSSSQVGDYFADLSGHIHASYINLLAKEGIVA